jgi:GNAT superfamily N-acetyltransferase
MDIRAANESEINHLASLWYNGWQDAHANILPVELARHRTLDSFRQRLQAIWPEVRVAGPIGEPVGLCLVKDDELNQLYVDTATRGTGIAARLLADGEAQMRARGIKTASKCGDTRRIYDHRLKRRCPGRAAGWCPIPPTSPHHPWQGATQYHSGHNANR